MLLEHLAVGCQHVRSAWLGGNEVLCVSHSPFASRMLHVFFFSCSCWYIHESENLECQQQEEMATTHIAAAVAANGLEEVVKASVARILRLAPRIRIYEITDIHLGKEKGARVHLTCNFNIPGLLALQALLKEGEMDCLVFRALCTRHMQGIPRDEVKTPVISRFFSYGHLAGWDTSVLQICVAARLEKDFSERATSLLLKGDARAGMLVFVGEAENNMLQTIPGTISISGWVRDMQVAFAMGLRSKGSPVWMLDACIVDMILRKLVEEVDESDVLAVLEKLDLNALK